MSEKPRRLARRLATAAGILALASSSLGLGVAIGGGGAAALPTHVPPGGAGRSAHPGGNRYREVDQAGHGRHAATDGLPPAGSNARPMESPQNHDAPRAGRQPGAETGSAVARDAGDDRPQKIQAVESAALEGPHATSTTTAARVHASGKPASDLLRAATTTILRAPAPRPAPTHKAGAPGAKPKAVAGPVPPTTTATTTDSRHPAPTSTPTSTPAQSPVGAVSAPAQGTVTRLVALPSGPAPSTPAKATPPPLQQTAPPPASAAKGFDGKYHLGALGEPMLQTHGPWTGISLHTADQLRIPIGLLVGAGVFLVAQALIDRRDPKVMRAPERNSDDTVGFL